jgi:hypothetical protein
MVKKEICKTKKIRRKGYLRRAYTRKDGTKVKATKVKSALITDEGKPGRGKKLYTLREEGSLSKYGYTVYKKKEARALALVRAVNKKGALKVLRRLVAIRTFYKNYGQNELREKIYKLLDKDVKYLQHRYYPKRAKSRRKKK